MILSEIHLTLTSLPGFPAELLTTAVVFWVKALLHKRYEIITAIAFLLKIYWKIFPHHHPDLKLIFACRLIPCAYLPSIVTLPWFALEICIGHCGNSRVPRLMRQ
jgi:hypothetical protein